MKRQMKDSGIEWIGQIPEEWHVSKIKNVYIVILGKMLSPSQTQKDQTLENYLCAANIKWSGVDTSIQKQMWFSESDKAEYKLHEGDILIMEGGLAGTSCKYRGEMAPCFIQNSVHCCRAKSNYSNQFLYYWMNVVYNSKYIENICNKATIQHYTKEKVMNTPFLICSSLEQEKIVSYLDRKCAQIDAIIAKQQQIIEKLKEYKLSVITEAVTKGLDPNVPMKDSGVEWIGKVPEHWKVPKIKYLATIASGGTPDRSHPEYWNGSINWAKTGELQNSELYETEEKITELALENSSAKVFAVDTILVAMYGQGKTRGMTALLKIPSATNQACAGITIYSKDITVSYLWLFLMGAYDAIREKANGSGQPNLSGALIADFNVTLPPVEEQINICKTIAMHLPHIDSIIKQKEAMIDRLVAYKKSLIYEVVTGKKEVKF